MARPKKQVTIETPKMSRDDYFAISQVTEGWLTDEESQGLWNAATYVAANTPVDRKVWAEVGSYAGRSTALLGGVLQLSGGGTLYAVDPHLGQLTSFSGYDGNRMLVSSGMVQNEPTYEKLLHTLESAELQKVVEVHKCKSTEFTPPALLNFLFIDGLHTYDDVKADWDHYKQFLLPDAVVCFHDYLDWADPTRLVDERIAAGELTMVSRAGSLAVCKFLGAK